MNNMMTQFYFMFYSKDGKSGYYIGQPADTQDEAINKAAIVLGIDAALYDVVCLQSHPLAKTHWLAGNVWEAGEELNHRLEEQE